MLVRISSPRGREKGVSAQIRWNKDAELTLPMRLCSRRVAESTAFDMLKLAPGDGRAAEQ